ncbi:hypothetical protein A3758_32215 [Oleiphilus sp. HI0118]|nr:hypothetical protein A3758_04255 [Oleiphilus sp. HI0118]KZZ48801.1 hypothetical protein A3758_32215 [Oleiphilus sp. HI0118]KZZ75561.1 hypothetical protein A3767_21635 [Oleiphilus sp. HI0133]KZZ80884.1 hypothetical protein A3767_09130 [Oleiphilus sp. HI0133]
MNPKKRQARAKKKAAALRKQYKRERCPRRASISGESKRIHMGLMSDRGQVQTDPSQPKPTTDTTPNGAGERI